MLTERAIEKLQPHDRQYAVNVDDPRVPGLEIRINTNGSKAWSLRYRIARHMRRMTLGRHPMMTLADAREEARKALRQVDDGHDPAVAKQERRTADTVGELASTYVEKHAKPKKRSWKSDERLLNTEVLPHWRHRLARDIKRRDVRELVDSIAARGPILANRVRALLHTMFAFAVQREIVDVNPVAGTPRPGVEHQRDRVLTDDEIRTFWTSTEALPFEMRAFWRLRLLTAQRGGEVESMRWEDIDVAAGLWTIPATVAKNKKEHRVPLSAPALEILNALRERADQLIEARNARKDARPKPVVLVFRGARGAKQQAAAAATFGIEDFRGHDLRRTAATNMRKAGVPRDDISRVLNHVEGGAAATRVYDRYDGGREKKLAVDTWARTLMLIVEQQDAAKVIQFGTR